MAGILTHVFRNNRIYVFLCTLAGVSPLVGLQGYAWDYPILMFYYFAEAVLITLIDSWKILACHLKATPDGSVQVLPSGAAKIKKAHSEEIVQPMPKSWAIAIFLFCSSFGIGISYIFMCIAFEDQRIFDNILNVIRVQWPLFAAAIAGLLVQRGYRFVSDFWLGPQRNYPPGYFVGRSFFRVYFVLFLVLSVRGIAYVSGSHFALVMAILIGARILIQIAFAIGSEKLWPPGQTTPVKQQSGISSLWDAEKFLLEATKDEALTRFLLDVAQSVGRDGYISVERGGMGKPYEANYQEVPPDNRKIAEVQAEWQNLKQALALAKNNTEHASIERRIAELAGGICIIRINVESTEEFNRQKTLIIDTWAKFKQASGSSA